MPLERVGAGGRGLTPLEQGIQANTPVVLHIGDNNWKMLPNGSIVLEDDPSLGLTVRNQQFESNAEIILHTGMNQWIVRPDGHIVLKDDPSLGLTVQNQEIDGDGARIILHVGHDPWSW